MVMYAVNFMHIPWLFISVEFSIMAAQPAVILECLLINLYLQAMTWKKKMAHHFLAPPAERQRSFSNTDLSVVRLSVCPSVCLSVRPSVKIEGGRGLSQKRFSNFSSFLA